MIAFGAYDKDLVSSDLLCAAEPIEYIEFCQNQEVNTHDIELQDKMGKKAGNILFSTQLIVIPKDPTEFIEMNCNCALQINIKEATFLKDQDVIGKQDPYIQFSYDSEDYKTEIQDNAGLHAKFSDVFVLENILNEIKEDG